MTGDFEELEEMAAREAARVELREAYAAALRAGLSVEDLRAEELRGAKLAEEEEAAPLDGEPDRGVGLASRELRASELRGLARRVERGEVDAIALAYRVRFEGSPVCLSLVASDPTVGAVAAQQCLDALAERFNSDEEG